MTGIINALRRLFCGDQGMTEQQIQQLEAIAAALAAIIATVRAQHPGQAGGGQVQPLDGGPVPKK